MTATEFENVDHAKAGRLDWLRRVYGHEPSAVSDEEADVHLFDRLNDFGMQHFVDNFRPLNKLREQRGPLEFSLGNVDHRHPDVCYAELCTADEVVFVLRIRFEAELPCRVKYWGSYPPLPEGVQIRPYTPADAAGCVALELACPFESDDGGKWSLDRGERFDEYLQLMAPVDAWVADFGGQIVGFFSCALRPIRLNDEDCYGAYQHHYRVHPKHRAGSISMAITNHVDARRSFENYAVPFPYSMVDPNNKHMKYMGFPPVDKVRIARMSLSVERLALLADDVALTTPSIERIAELMDLTHGDRALYPRHDRAYLDERWSRTATFNHNNYLSTQSAFVALWDAQELNIIEGSGVSEKTEVRRLSFLFDYGFTAVAELLPLLAQLAQTLNAGKAPASALESTTHLCLVCDTRAPEYALLQRFADDEALLALHTLPWIVEPLQSNVIYCDAIYC